MDRYAWIERFTRRAFELEERLDGTDFDDDAMELVDLAEWHELGPEAAAERYYAGPVADPGS